MLLLVLLLVLSVSQPLEPLEPHINPIMLTSAVACYTLACLCHSKGNDRQSSVILNSSKQQTLSMG